MPHATEDIPRFNEELAIQVLQSVLANPSKHAQSNWINLSDWTDSLGAGSLSVGDSVEFDLSTLTSPHLCGTSACLAGWATLHDGYELKLGIDDAEDPEIVIELFKDGAFIKDDIGNIDLEDEGEEALGLSTAEANELFMTMDEKRAIAMLYSKIKTGDLQKLIWDEESRLLDELGDDFYDSDLPAYNVFDRARDEYTPVPATV